MQDMHFVEELPVGNMRGRFLGLFPISGASIYSRYTLGRVVFERAARFPIAAVGLCSLSFVLVKTGRDALFFTSRELTDLALAFGLIALAAVPFALAHLKLMKQVGCRRARTAVLLVSGLSLILAGCWIDFNSAGLSIALFVIVPVLFSAIFAGVWLLAGDLLEDSPEETKSWAYTRIGASSLLGGTLGGAIGRLLAEAGSPYLLLLAGGLGLLVTAAVVVTAHRRYPLSLFSASLSIREDEGQAWSGFPVSTAKLMRLPFMLTLTGVAGLAALAGQFIDFQFYAAAQLTGNTSASFFAGFYTLLNGVALLLQLFATPVIQSRLGVAGSLLVLPLGLLGSTVLVALSSTLFSRALLKISEDGLKSAVHRSTWEQAFLALHRRSRAVAKVVVDGISVRAAEGLGAVTLYSLVCLESSQYACLNWLNWILIVVVVFWIVSTAVLARLGCEPAGDVRYQIRLPGS